MKVIPLTKGKSAKIDDADFDLVSIYNWYATSRGYAARRKSVLEGSTLVLMHREIMSAPDGLVIDHINHDPLDNQRSNLRIVTQSQNCMNSRLANDNTSGFKGVCYDKNRNKWVTQIGYQGRYFYLGRFDDIEEAVKARSEAESRLFGEFACQR